MATQAGTRIYSIGHSTRPLGEFLSLLRENRVRTVADVRTIPRSRRNPQYESESLARELERVGLGYRHLPGLGGLRRPRPDSPNDGWRNPSFRGYADHMASPAFAEGLETLLALADEGPLALLCAEAVPWRCHRSLIADALLVRGISVAHIMGPGVTRDHRLTPFACVSGQTITYPAVALVGE